jgi:hypothetical protein
MRGIKRAAPYIASGLGFCGIGGGLYYMFVERGYKVEDPRIEGPNVEVPDFSGPLIDFLKKLIEWLGHHPNSGTPDASSTNASASHYSSAAQSSSGTSAESSFAHIPVELLPVFAVAMVVILAIGYQCYASQKASPRMGGR